MLDKFNRKINYLRISVTDRCNLRCTYCMPAEGIDTIEHNKVLKFEEIFEFTKVAVNLGVTKLRLTGGEPLVRKGIIDLVEMLAGIDGIEDFAMTTNGILLYKYAADLKKVGLHRVNISLDTMDPKKFKEITRGGNIEEVFRGIEAAKAAGLNPVKVNCVIKKSPEEIDAQKVKKYAEETGVDYRFIEQMDMEKGRFGIVHGGTGGDCEICNRFRLTSDGFLKPCLFNNYTINIRDFNNYEDALLKALEMKPKCGSFNDQNQFYNIGG